MPLFVVLATEIIVIAMAESITGTTYFFLTIFFVARGLVRDSCSVEKRNFYKGVSCANRYAYLSRP